MSAQTPESRITSFAQFYPYYLEEHSNVICRRLHFIGTTAVIGCFVMIALTGNWWWFAATPLVGYGFAWVGHFFFEKNRPATFTYPLYSLAADWVMYADILRGRVSIIR
ncbi:MAG: DUF962 domain-containing protein [Pseudomonadota bacterium]